MAIKAKSAKEDIQLPEELKELIKKGFTEQQLSSHYDDEFKKTKQQALDMIEASEDITIEVGTALKTEFGSINLIETDRKKIDKDKIIELVEAGKISIVDVLSCVSTFKNDELEKVMSSALFKTVAESSVSSSFTWKISPDFKKECEDAMGSPVATVAAPKLKPVKIEAEKELKRVAAKDSATKAKATSKARSLDDILKGK